MPAGNSHWLAQACQGPQCNSSGWLAPSSQRKAHLDEWEVRLAKQAKRDGAATHCCWVPIAHAAPLAVLGSTRLLLNGDPQLQNGAYDVAPLSQEWERFNLNA